MSVINTNQYATGFAPPNLSAEFATAGGIAPGEYAAGYAQPADNIQYGGYGPSFPAQSAVSYSSGSYAGTSSGDFSFSSILNQIGSLISGLFQQLGSVLGGSSSGSTPPSTGYPGPGGQPETYFTSANSSSTGDPHLAFDGTNANGATVSDKWNSMTSHPDLLDSNSFSGGYQVSTQVTTPSDTGVTHNASATVTTNNGATVVTMDKDGSYSVTENGQNVALTQGQATSVGNGETVTLNSDGSLTVADANGSGGTITTTLKANDHGVDVTNSAQNVDLGGFLVTHTDNQLNPGGVQAGFGPYPSTGMGYNASAAPATSAPLSYAPYETPYQTPAFSEPMVTGLEQFDPENSSTNLENIELA
jgi:hypothetical protein